ncbi:P-loop containing nucleoside triphosphate hydrolase protein [Blyttiomyces helicus]|uniref:P-loop containing nucleoside triphosphate hydrolase protein n=1 Tax=Blyttiomyces helicus TaxID=388810 RepID=A0A4P9WCD4_9FUNG|nr:P-loop containing nucleoside triphosphate hydrolase protein [Blyttiomyces helicus]|eukprot:RKO90319.1 P-loop containing nucleoside triphosphate hydrolase protein [Blyttiomyces helicus]
MDSDQTPQTQPAAHPPSPKRVDSIIAGPDAHVIDIPASGRNSKTGRVNPEKSANAGPDISLSWSDVSLSVKISKTESKTLLHNLSGEVHSGEVVAIMGGSGAGKTTLLNTLAGRIGPSELSGDILVNGSPRSKSTWRKLCAYVEQDDLMYTNFSVFDTLTYSALLRLPSSLTPAEKAERVETIIMQLGLNGCRDTWIGNAEHKGISGGERKRVSIGIELVTDPRILFLDEPTSGLDAFTAFNIIDELKKLAVKRNMLVIMTIHQPRTDILELFDRCILLSTGKTMWFGTTQDALDHFSALGYPLPPKTNPSDYFLDIITLDQRSEELRAASLKRITQFSAAWNERQGNDEKRKKSPVVSVAEPEVADKFPRTIAAEFATLLHRNMKNVARTKSTIGATIGQGIIIMLVMGFIFFKVGNNATGVQNRLGVLFFIAVNQTFGVVMPTIGIFPIERQIIKRERAAGTYRSISVFAAKVVSTLPLTFLGALLLAIPVYWMIGLQADAGKYGTFIVIVLVHSFVANALGLMIGSAVPNPTVGQILGPLSELQWLSIIAYTNKALTQNEFTGLVFDPCPPQSTQVCYTDGQAVLDQFNLTNPCKWCCVAVNVGLACGFLTIGFLIFRKTSRPFLKLQ